MSIKQTYDNVADIPEGMEALYSQTDSGAYQIKEIEGMVGKGKVDEFRENNINLRKQMEGFESQNMDSENRLTDMQSQMKAMEEKYSDIDLDQWAEQQAETKRMAEKEMIEKGDVDSLINGRVDEVLAAKAKEIATMKSSYEEQLLSMQKDLASYDSQLNTMLVDNELTKVAGQHGIRASATEDLVSRGRTVFRVEDGQATAFNNEGRQMYLEDAVTPLSIDGWVEGLTKSAPHLFESSTGAAVTQPTSTPVQPDVGLNTHDSILAGLAGLDK